MIAERRSRQSVTEDILERLSGGAFHRTVGGRDVQRVLQSAAGERDGVVRGVVAEGLRPREVGVIAELAPQSLVHAEFEGVISDAGGVLFEIDLSQGGVLAGSA